MDWEQRLAALWATIDQQLVAELPVDDAVGIFEWAASLDSTGHSDRAVPLYRRALALGLPGIRRRRAVIQMASSLRNLGQAEESVTLLRAEREVDSDELDDAVSAVLALALVDTGHEREAVSIAVAALAPHLPRYLTLDGKLRPVAARAAGRLTARQLRCNDKRLSGAKRSTTPLNRLSAPCRPAPPMYAPLFNPCEQMIALCENCCVWSS